MQAGEQSLRGAPIRGTPRRFSALLPLKPTASGEASLRLTDEKGQPVGEELPVRFRDAKVEGFAKLKFKLGRTVPPGRYKAELRVDDVTHPLELEVEPIVLLRAEPPMMKFEAAPGQTASAEFVLANEGNVAVDVPDHAATGTFNTRGVETAIGHAYRADTDDGLEILKTFVEGLRDNYGGLFKIRVEEGAGPLEPGSARLVRAIVQLPSRLKPHQIYSGLWSLGNLRLSIRVSVRSEESQPGTTPR